MEKKDDFKIDWDAVSKNEQQQKEQPNEKEEVIEPAESVNEKDSFKFEKHNSKLNRERWKQKYEKVKLRPLNFTAFVMIIVITALSIGLVGFALYQGVMSVFASGFNLKAFFGDKVNAFTFGLMSVVGVVLQILIVLFILALLYLFIMTIINGVKNIKHLNRLNYCSNKDYTKNLYAISTIVRSICMVLITTVIALYLFFFYAESVALVVPILCVVCAVLFIVVSVLLGVALSIAHKNFKKETSDKDIYATLFEKNEEVKKYFSRMAFRRSHIGAADDRLF